MSQNVPGVKKKIVVVPSGHARSVVEGWLNRTGHSTESREPSSSDSSYMVEGRPARLGLGAKYLPHNLALAATQAPVQKRLEKKLSQYKASGQRDNSNEEASTSRNLRWVQPQAEGSQQGLQANDSDSESDEEGKGGKANIAKKTVKVLHTREDLLKAPLSKKQKKKMHGK